MDRDQRSRRQKSAANPPPRAQHRSMKSRMGLRKDPPRQASRPAGARPAAGGQAPRRSLAAPSRPAGRQPTTRRNQATAPPAAPGRRAV